MAEFDVTLVVFCPSQVLAILERMGKSETELTEMGTRELNRAFLDLDLSVAETKAVRKFKRTLANR